MREPMSTTRSLGAEISDTATATNGGLLADYLAAQRDIIVEGEIAARAGDAAAIPEVIVAARRARSALAAHRGACDRHRELRGMIEDLRWFGLALGAAHDLDVQATRVRSAVGSLRARYLRGPVRDRVDRYFGYRLEQARIEGRALLGSRRYLDVLTDLDTEIDELRSGAFRWASEDRCDLLLADLVARVEDRTRAVGAAGGEDARDAAVHSVRKAVRRTRYYLESVRCREPERGLALTALELLQDELGEHHDAVVAKRHLMQIVRDAEKSREPGFTYGLLYQRELDVTDRLAGSLPRTVAEAMRSVQVLTEAARRDGEVASDR